MAKARILHLLTNSAIGGTERMVLEFIARADRQRFDWFIGALLSGGPLFGLAADLGIPSVDFKKRRFFEFAALLKLFYFMKENRIDLVHLYGLQADVLGRLAARLAGVPAVVSAIRGPEPWRQWYHSWLDRSTSGLVDLYISNSEAGRQTALEREKISPQKVVTIHNGIDLTRFDGVDFEVDALRRTYGLTANTPLVGVIANLRPMKGHADVIAALPLIIEQIPDIRFMFVGRDDMNGAIHSLAQESGLAQHIIFTGFHSDVRPFYQLFDLFLLPSTWEGCPVSILEAMAMSKPVVATAVGGVPELVVDGQTGRLISPHCPQSIAGAVVALLKEPAAAQQMGRAGRSHVEEHFTLPKMIVQIEAVYDELLAARGSFRSD
ncbi:MAG: glycosyltransferase [Chloroflexota bacterium]